MIIEILGVDPRNKGALLMLEAICAKLRAEAPHVRIAVPAPWPDDARTARGLWLVAPRQGGSKKLRILAHAPEELRRMVQLVQPEQVDVVLDASGFAYGDFWGAEKLEKRLGGLVRTWKKLPGKKLVLLPQAFGPFEDAALRKGIGDVVAGADLVFARDATSLAHVTAAADGRGDVRRAPDFTNLLHPELPRRLAHLKGRALVIPNEKLLAGGDAARRETYLRFLTLAVETLAGAGKDTALLVHEGEKDRALAEAVNDALARPVDIIDEGSALATKALIGASELIVSSRFHGLVSALSSGVPALACGWSHKYRELMADYDCAAHVVELDKEANWSARLDALLEDAASATFRAQLAAAGEAQRALSHAMWDDVLALLRGVAIKSEAPAIAS